MPVIYVNYKDMRKNGSGLTYARAIHPSTVKLADIAERIEHNTSMTKGDCLSVLTEMVTVMTNELQNSSRVVLDGFGTFALNLSTHGAVSEEVFDINKCLKNIHVNFLPTGTRSNGVMTRTFVDGVKLQKFTTGSSSSGSATGTSGTSTGGSDTSNTGSNDSGQAGE